MMRLLLIGVFVFHGMASMAQAVEYLGRSSPVTKVFTGKVDPASIFISNQAALAECTTPSAEIYSEKRFMLPDLHLFSATAALPLHDAGLGVLMTYAGNPFFSQLQFGIAIGKKISDCVSVGIQFNYLWVASKQLATSRLLAADAAVLFKLADKLRTGLQLKNVVHTSAAKARFPLIYKAAVGYECSDQVHLYAAVEKGSHVPAMLTVSFIYIPHPLVILQAGCSAEINDLFFSIAFKRKRERLELTAGYHRLLGFTPSFAFGFPLSKTEKE